MVALQYVGEVPLLEVRGDVDVYTAEHIFERVRELTSADTSFLLSLESCRYFDCSGIRQVIRLLREGRQFSVVAPKEIRRVFELTKVNKIIPIASTRQDALQCLRLWSSLSAVVAPYVPFLARR